MRKEERKKGKEVRRAQALIPCDLTECRGSKKKRSCYYCFISVQNQCYLYTRVEESKGKKKKEKKEKKTNLTLTTYN